MRHGAERDGSVAGRRCHRPPARRDRRPAGDGSLPETQRSLVDALAHLARRGRRGAANRIGARGGTFERVRRNPIRPVGEGIGRVLSATRAGRWAASCLVPPEVGGSRGGYRGGGRGGRHRLLRRTRSLHPLLPERLCRLPDPDTGQVRAASPPRPPPPGPGRLPLVAGVGALLGAILVYRVAPEAEGHGTDAAISAVHHNPRGVRFRAVIVKIVASALTIGSGGSGGREGPTGQISAGFGSLLARTLDLDPADARIAVRHGHRVGHRGHLRRTAGRRGAGRRDPLPRRLRPGRAVAELHRLRLSATSSSVPPRGTRPSSATTSTTTSPIRPGCCGSH